MERLKQAVVKLALTPAVSVRQLPLLERGLAPVLTAAAMLYSGLWRLRILLYRWRWLPQRRLPLPVLAVGNLSWGGTGKTPMVEYLASCCIAAGIRPLLLTRGYGGGDEARLLASRLMDLGDVGCGADRGSIASGILRKRGVISWEELQMLARNLRVCEGGLEEMTGGEGESRVGVIILDDGLQQWGLVKDLELVMVNAITMWGNGKMVPRGPLREPLKELRRADVVVIHHADLVPESRVKRIKAISKTNALCLCSRMAPQYFTRLSEACLRLSLDTVEGAVVMCVSGIGCPQSLSLAMKQLGAFVVAEMNFSDHHQFTSKDTSRLDKRAAKLEQEYQSKVVIVITAKDYMRDVNVFKEVKRAEILVLHSALKMMDDPPSMEFLQMLLVRAFSDHPLKVVGFPVSLDRRLVSS